MSRIQVAEHDLNQALGDFKTFEINHCYTLLMPARLHNLQNWAQNKIWASVQKARKKSLKSIKMQSFVPFFHSLSSLVILCYLFIILNKKIYNFKLLPWILFFIFTLGNISVKCKYEYSPYMQKQQELHSSYFIIQIHMHFWVCKNNGDAKQSNSVVYVPSWLCFSLPTVST